MGKIYIILFSILIHFYNCNAQSSVEITGNIQSDLNALLPSGQIEVDIMDQVKQNQRQVILTQKFQQAIKSNSEWFFDYVKKTPQGQPIGYHPNLGMTEEEYKELQDYMNNMEVTSSGTRTITIKNDGKTIYFLADETLAVLGKIKIDLALNEVYFGDEKLSFYDKLDITNSSNGFKSPWKGYQWKLEEPKDFNPQNVKDIKNLKAKQYKFTIGKIEKNSKVYMNIEGKEIENGIKKENFNIPLFFNK